MNVNNWTCPTCGAVNEQPQEEIATVSCAGCSAVFDASYSEQPQRVAFKPALIETALSKEKVKSRRRPSDFGTTLLFLAGLGVGCLGLLFASQITAGIIIACGGLGLVLIGGIYHLGHRLELILEELQDR